MHVQSGNLLHTSTIGLCLLLCLLYSKMQIWNDNRYLPIRKKLSYRIFSFLKDADALRWINGSAEPIQVLTCLPTRLRCIKIRLRFLLLLSYTINVYCT